MEKRIKLADDEYSILNDLCSQNSISNSYILKFIFLNYLNEFRWKITKTKVIGLDKIDYIFRKAFVPISYFSNFKRIMYDF
jgi:hypothetical protein